MSRRLRKAELRQQRREREISRHFRDVRLCSKCGSVMKVQKTSLGRLYVGPTCG